MGTYQLTEAFHVCDGDDEFDWPAGTVTATSDAEERVLAGMAARGHATLVAEAAPPEVEPDPAPPAGAEGD